LVVKQFHFTYFHTHLSISNKKEICHTHFPVFVLEEKELFSYGAGKQFSLLELLPSTLVTRKKEVFSKRSAIVVILR
jgi:hypothetical protein